MPCKVLIVYYTRTGNTAKVAQELATELGADVERVEEKRDKAGLMGAIRSGKNLFLNKLADIESPKKDPSQYDIVVIGTPILLNQMSLPIRAYITRFKHKFKSVAFFCVGGLGSKKAFKDMAYVCGKAPKATLGMSYLTYYSGQYKKRIAEFTKSILDGSGQP